MVTRETSEAFFYEAVVEAMGRANVDASDHTEFYLVNLLNGYTKSPISSEPLAIKYLEDAPPAQRVLALQEVGDTSLYVTGYFPESLERSPVGVGYYASIGSLAYSELSSRMAGALKAVFGELSERFRQFIDVLLQVRELTWDHT